MTPSLLERLAPPPYLRAEQDIVLWHALEAAIHTIRQLSDAPFLSDKSDVELDEAIRYGLIPRVLAEQEHLLPPLR